MTLNGHNDGKVSVGISIRDYYIYIYDGTNLRKLEYFSNILDFPGGPVVMSLLANSGDASSIPGPGRFQMLQGN